MSIADCNKYIANCNIPQEPIVLVGSIPVTNRRVPHIPDFLWSFVGSLNFMRLSLKKGAHAVLSRAAYRKFGASRSFFARCGIPQASPSTLSRGDGSTRVLKVRPSVPGPKTMGEAHHSLSFRIVPSIISSKRLADSAFGLYPRHQSTGAPSFAFFAKGGIVDSHPSTSHNNRHNEKLICSLGGCRSTRTWFLTLN
jgi:hypothetical protein